MIFVCKLDTHPRHKNPWSFKPGMLIASASYDGTARPWVVGVASDAEYHCCRSFLLLNSTSLLCDGKARVLVQKEFNRSIANLFSG
jgi:hypothetical protein